MPTVIACLVIIALALVATGSVAHAQEAGSSSEPGQSKGYDEAEAISIDRMLMCPVCPAETIDQAQVEVSRQMRLIVREMLSQGSSRDEILDFFVGNYGADILAAPPKSGWSITSRTMTMTVTALCTTTRKSRVCRPYFARNFAMMIMRTTFASSTGWKPSGPTKSQPVVPRMVVPKKSTVTSRVNMEK